MFDSLKTFVVYGIQSHEKTILHFKRNGVHRISGNNSDGKSVIMKSMYALFFGEYLNKQGRYALIPWDKEFGIISAESYNGVVLNLFLHLESSKCFYELNYNGQKIRKTLADDYKTLLKVANFHYLPDEKFSLNRYKTKTTLPFTHTSGGLNYKLLDSASEVPQVKELIAILDDNLVTIKSDREIVERKILSLSEQLKYMDDTGISELEDRIKYVETLYTNYTNLKPIKLSVEAIHDSNNKIKELDLNDYSLADPLIEQLKFMERLKETLTSVEEVNKKIDNLSKNNLKEPMEIKGHIEQLYLITSLIETGSKIYESQIGLSNKSEFNLVNIDHIFQTYNEISKLIKVLNTVDESNKVLSRTKLVSKPLPLDKVTEQLKLIMELKELNNSRLSTIDEISSVKRNIIILNNDINALTKEIGICKYCGGTLTENHHHNIG